MADILRSDVLEPQIRTSSSEAFKEATRAMGRGLHQFAKDNESTTLNEILQKVYDWENEFEGKVQPEEIEALQTLSLMLGLLKYQSEHKSTDVLSVRKQNIEVEHEILRTVFNNLDETGKPNEVISRSFSVVSSVFDVFFDPNNQKIAQQWTASNGLWIGMMGVTTTALMFHNEGWEVRLPDQKLDLEYEADLLVKNKKGEVFSVDITSQTPRTNKGLSNTDQLFSVVKSTDPSKIKEVMPEVVGTIKVNIPPLMSRESQTFYENRRTGYPNERSMNTFRQNIK